MRSLVIPVAVALVATWGEASPALREPCPSGFARDAPREARVTNALKKTPEGVALLARTSAAFCFGEASISMVSGRALLLNEVESDEALAPRAGHLLAHIEAPRPLDMRGGDCEARVARALEAEARAIALELRLAEALGQASPYAFHDAFWAAEAAGRERVVYDFLASHPHGGGGVDALADGYGERCRRGEP